MEIIILTFAIPALYTIGLLYWTKRVKRNIGAKATNRLVQVHAVMLVLIIVFAPLYAMEDISIRGMWSNRIVIWLFLITSIAIFIFGEKSAFHKITRYYFLAVASLPILAGLFLLVPFLGPVLVWSFAFRLAGSGDELLYRDSKIRIQSTFYGVLGTPHLEVFRKSGLIETRIYTSGSDWITAVDSVNTVIAKDVTSWAIYHNGSEGTLNPLVITRRE